MDHTMTLPPLARYRRQLAEGDFSLEANTESVPEPGHYYLLQNGLVLLRTENFRTAEKAYHDLCRQHWQGQLESDTPACRLTGAWGLVGLEPENPAAAAVILRDGQPADGMRLLRMQKRRRSEKAAQGRRTITPRAR